MHTGTCEHRIVRLGFVVAVVALSFGQADLLSEQGGTAVPALTQDQIRQIIRKAAEKILGRTVDALVPAEETIRPLRKYLLARNDRPSTTTVTVGWRAAAPGQARSAER